jgi:hypothetical protein
MNDELKAMTEAMDRHIESIEYVGADQLTKDWDESRVFRAKTTPESTPGSFAPQLQGPQKIMVDSWEYKRPDARQLKRLSVLYNPTYSELKRWAFGEVKRVRYLPLQQGGFVFWDAYEALHQQVAMALKQPFKPYDGGTGDVSDIHRDSPDLFRIEKSWLVTLRDKWMGWVAAN